MFSVPTSTTSVLGLVKPDGTTLLISAGVVSANPAVVFNTTAPLIKYSHAGTQLAACAVGTVGEEAVVSDASSLTPGTAYSITAGAGSIVVRVQCTLTGSTYAWQTE